METKSGTKIEDFCNQPLDRNGWVRREIPSETFLVLMRELRFGSEEAANTIYNRYLECILRLAKRKLDPSLVAKVTPETIAQTAMFAFFNGVSKGQYEIKNWASLYGLLASITIRKALNRNRFYHQEIRGEGQMASVSLEEFQPSSVSLGPAEEAEIKELEEVAFSKIDPKHKIIIEIYLQNKSKDDAVIGSGYSSKTVERVLKEFETYINQMSQEQ